MILGITGGTGSGKTTLLDIIRQHGGLVLDCDQIYHDLLEQDGQLLAAICQRFPTAFENGKLNRKKLGAIVFEDNAALLELNAITHSAVRQEVQRRLKSWQGLAAIDAIALMESGLGALCDLTVTVTAPLEVRVSRLMARDGISEEYARRRITAQKNEEWFREKTSFVLENNGSLDSFQRKCLAFLETNGIISSCDEI